MSKRMGMKLVVLACAAAMLFGVLCPLRAGEKKDEWTVLFGGKDEDLKTHWNVPKPRKGKWFIEDGVLALKPGTGYIWTKEKFDHFVLDMDFKVAKGCNSGIFIRSNPRNPVQGGMEIQVLDSFGKKKPGKHDMAALYDCLAPSKNACKKAEEWQHITITANDNLITVVLNDEKVLEADLNKWTEPRKNPDGSKNKFKTAYKDLPRTGHIGFQDHGKPVWFRNVKVKKLPKPQK